VWSAISVYGSDVGADGIYTMGRGRGVYAVGLDGDGVFGFSYNNAGVRGATMARSVAAVIGHHTDTGEGVLGFSDRGGVGVHGQTFPAGIEGQSPAGVLGESIGPQDGDGVRGTSTQGIGVRGDCSGGVAPIGVQGNNTSNDPTGVGVAAFGGVGIGLVAAGAQAAISLSPNLTITGAPKTGFHEMGEMMVDQVGDLYLCKATGTPGKWVKVA
jgi:hypothetical protein